MIEEGIGLRSPADGDQATIHSERHPGSGYHIRPESVAEVGALSRAMLTPHIRLKSHSRCTELCPQIPCLTLLFKSGYALMILSNGGFELYYMIMICRKTFPSRLRVRLQTSAKLELRPNGSTRHSHMNSRSAISKIGLVK